MTNSIIKHPWNNKSRLDLFETDHPTLEERTEKMLSIWHNFPYKVKINNLAYAKQYLREKDFELKDAFIKEGMIGFKNKIDMTEYLLKRKDV